MKLKYVELPSNDKYVESIESRRKREKSLDIVRNGVELFFNKIYEIVREEK